MPKSKKFLVNYRISYSRPIDAKLAGAVIPGTCTGLAFEQAPDELTARFQFSKRFPTAMINMIEEIPLS